MALIEKIYLRNTFSVSFAPMQSSDLGQEIDTYYYWLSPLS